MKLRVALAALWLALLIAGLLRLRLDVQVLNLLPPELPSVQGLKLYEEHFANANELVISLQGAEAAVLERAARELASILRERTNLVSEAVWTPPWEEHPDQTGELVSYLWLNQPPENITPLLERFQNEATLREQLERTKSRLATTMSPQELARLSYDPFGLLELPGESGEVPVFGQGADLFASSDGTFRLLFVEAREVVRNYRDSQRFLEGIRAAVGTWRSREPGFGGITVKFTGRPAFVSEISGNMERDITSSAAGTLLIVAGLFGWAHRRWKPLLWLIAMLLLILLTTLAAGGLIFGELNVISIGFAAILLGLAVDYGLVLYQEFLDASGQTARAVRQSVAPSIVWAAATTAGAFLALNLGGLPGLAQLGTLVGLGVSIGASVMLGLFLLPMRVRPATDRSVARESGRPSLVWGATVALGVGGGIFMWMVPPRIDISSASLRPGHSAAFQAVEEIKTRMNRPREPLWVLAEGNSYDEVGEKLEAIAPILREAKEKGLIARATIPESVGPRPGHQSVNGPRLAAISAREAELERAARAAGFNEESMGLTRQIFATWRRAEAKIQAGTVFQPSQETGHWILERLISQTPGRFLALGLIHPPENAEEIQPALLEKLRQQGVLVAGWELLGGEVFSVMREHGPRLAGWVGLVVLLSLGLAFRSFRSVLLSLAALASGALLLNLAMRALGLHWNLMNLMALPLLVGAGLDYSIHIQLGLRRHDGNVPKVRHSVGKALFLCAATTSAGFGSLSWAGNPGLASMGAVCATGIACAWFVAVWLLPAWWTAAHRQAPA